MYRYLLLILIFNLYSGSPSAETLRRFSGSDAYYASQNPKEAVLLVLPNPTTGLFTIIYKSENKGNLTLSVCDATGKYVYLKMMKDFDGEIKEQIDLSGLPRGLYVVEGEDDKQSVNKKVILQ
jgi:hypothetical protein